MGPAVRLALACAPETSPSHGTAEENIPKTSQTFGGLGRDSHDPLADGGVMMVSLCYEQILISVLPFVLSVFTIMGNIFVLIAITTNRTIARKQTSILLLNLAVADLLVGAVVMPLAVTLMVTQGVWLFGRFMCRLWVSLDVICSTASIVTLCVISVDRYLGVMHPLRYQSIVTRERLMLACVMVWLFSFGVLLATIRYHSASHRHDHLQCQVGSELRYVPQSVVCSFFVPLVTILAVYAKIFRVTQLRRGDLIVVRHTNAHGRHSENGAMTGGRRRQLRKSASMLTDGPLGSHSSVDGAAVSAAALTAALARGRRGTISVCPPPRLRMHYGGAETERAKQRRVFETHRKSALTLGLVVGAFLLCWLPFFTAYLSQHFCGCVAPWVLHLFTWLGYSNSALNPIIYAVIVTAFRDAFLDIIGRNLCALSHHEIQAKRQKYRRKFSTPGLLQRAASSGGSRPHSPPPNSPAPTTFRRSPLASPLRRPQPNFRMRLDSSPPRPETLTTSSQSGTTGATAAASRQEPLGHLSLASYEDLVAPRVTHL